MEELTILASVEESAIIHDWLNRPVDKDSSTAFTECLAFLKFGFSIVIHNNPKYLQHINAKVPNTKPIMHGISFIMASYVPFYDIGINQVVIRAH